MGIKLEWEVESEQTQLRATEDPDARQRRRKNGRRFLLLLIGILTVLAGLAAVIKWRLDQVDHQYRQDLIDTVEIEVAALRLGDFAAFMAIQRSASEAFMLEQSRRFSEYQDFKRSHRLALTGDVQNVTIDNLRGRVVLQETIDGVPYQVVWFYWYYEDDGPNNQSGWRHVPDDLTFWGDEAEVTAGPVRVTYRKLDERLAEALAPRLQDWWARGCALLGCSLPPDELRVEIVAERPSTVEWADYDPWTLRVTSPLVGRARADVAIPADLGQAIADQVADRLVRHAAGEINPPIYSDAAWLHDDLSRWLAQALLTGDTPTQPPGFIESLIAQFGTGVPAQVARALQTDATLDGTLTAITGVPFALISLDQLNMLDWQGFFQWRLALETRLLAQADTGGAFLALYDLEDALTSQQAQLRIEDAAYAARPVPAVGVVAIAREANGQTYAYVETAHTQNDVPISETVIWRLAGNTWKRIN
ncbi:MAG: hypothetical protein GXY36_06635 [Chloroflexi bacterium]|nr:hypothetical protein [Chloroflexota bacterium]